MNQARRRVFPTALRTLHRGPFRHLSLGILSSFVLSPSSFTNPRTFFSPSSFILYPSSLILLLLLAGCRPSLENRYGQRFGPGAAQSVNGTAVLGEMFERAGHRVSSWRTLSPRLKKNADAIVWFPDNFQPPSGQVIGWLESWLVEKPGRTLIYIGRDYDAEPFYWRTVLPGAPPEQASLVQGELTTAENDFSRERSLPSGTAECPWFKITDLKKPRQVRTLNGDADWTSDIDPAKLDVELFSRMDPGDDTEVLLRCRRNPLVSQRQIGESSLILVANGSFLLNLPLVNHEHRKLAGKLIDAVGEPDQSVVFLESGPDGPTIAEKDPRSGMPTGLEIFQIWPTSWILLHLAAAGVLFCFARWPIFGRPRRLPAAPPTDFGQHLDAQAALLRRSRDRAYAMSRFLHYKQLIGEGKG
jgi:hypothetical protein